MGVVRSHNRNFWDPIYICGTAEGSFVKLYTHAMSSVSFETYSTV